MMRAKSVLQMAVAAVASMALVHSASAGTIVEYFDYGSASGTNLTGHGGKDGDWSTGWEPAEATPDYYPNVNLTYDAIGYSNDGNGPNTGAVGADAGGGSAGSKAKRGITYPGYKGTVWISALVKVADNSSDALLWLGGSNSNNFVAIRGKDLVLRYNGVDSKTAAPVIADQTNLFLVKVVVGEGSAPDSVDFWFNPDLSQGEQGLPQPALSGSGSHIFGMADGDYLDLSAVQVSLAKVGSYIDAIRISNDADGFMKVTAVPEPAVAGLAGVISLGVLGRRHR